MSEITYIKTFLTTLDSKPTKYSPDHIFDPKTFPPRVPYTLPKLPTPPHPLPPTSSTTSAPSPPPGATPSTTLTIHLKSTRHPTLSLSLPKADPSTTTIPQLKELVLRSLGDPAGFTLEKVKILHNKKPVGAGKRTVADVLEGDESQKKERGDGEGEVEFGVMVIGGSSLTTPSASSTSSAAAVSASAPAEAAQTQAETETETETGTIPPAQGPSGMEVLRSEEFWSDLKGFLVQRLKDEGEAGRVVGVFRGALGDGSV
ncbi:MAG: hypothetical protein Q9227_007632, partial [Pyrenula ochraceoflavens]